jgi:hypothetical protein
MKTALVAVPFSLVILGLLAVAGSRWWGAPAAAMPPDGAALKRIEERLHRLEKTLGKLADLEQEVARLSTREGLAVTAPLAEAASPGNPADESAPAGARPADTEVGKAENKVDRWLEANGMRDDMESYIARVYEQARKVRMNRERDEAQAREREMQELSQGPYGKHNYRVNLLTKRLDLDGRQTDYLYNLLSSYEERAAGLKRELVVPEGTKPTPEQMEQHFQHLAQAGKSLRDGLESDFLSGLNAEQQEAYGELPEDERVGGPAGEKMLYVRKAVDMLGVQGMKVEVAPAPLPPPGAGR